MTYDWPSPPGNEPMPTQKLVTRHMLEHPRSYVFSDMRTGKTRSALWAADIIMRHVEAKGGRIRCVIVSDIEALTKSWVFEIRSCFFGRRSLAVLHGGSAGKRVQALSSDVDFYLINHDGLKIGFNHDISRCDKLAKAILGRDDLQIVIFDEAATYRNWRTDNTRSAYHLLSKRAKFAWALTGTPTPNGPLDAFGIKKLIDLDYRGNFTGWKDYTTYKEGPFKVVPRDDADEKVHQLLSPAVRVSRDQCFVETGLTMPDPIKVPLSEVQKKLMKELKNELAVMLTSGAEISAVNQAALRAKLIQISCGVVYDHEHNTHEIDPGPRLRILDKLVDKIEGKIIIFSPLTSLVHLLHRHFGKDKCIMISRKDQAESERREALNEFMSGSRRILVGHPGPICRGTDLTCANTIIWYAPCDRTEYYLQGNQRINGPRQTRQRQIIRLSSSDIEDEIYRRLENNESFQGAILKLKTMEI